MSVSAICRAWLALIIFLFFPSVVYAWDSCSYSTSSITAACLYKYPSVNPPLYWITAQTATSVNFKCASSQYAYDNQSGWAMACSSSASCPDGYTRDLDSGNCLNDSPPDDCSSGSVIGNDQGIDYSGSTTDGSCDCSDPGQVPNPDGSTSCVDPQDDCSSQPYGDLSGSTTDGSCDCPVGKELVTTGDNAGSCQLPCPDYQYRDGTSGICTDRCSNGFTWDVTNSVCSCPEGVVGQLNDVFTCVASGLGGSSAETASNTASTAASSAETASNTASTASSSSETASNTSSIASSSSETASNTASTATSSAATATNTASTATNTANTAANTASTATSSAATATNTASTATNTANIAAGIGETNSQLGNINGALDGISGFLDSMFGDDGSLDGEQTEGEVDLSEVSTQIQGDAEASMAGNEAAATSALDELKGALTSYLMPTITYSGSCEIGAISLTLGSATTNKSLTWCDFLPFFEILGNILFFFANIKAMFIFLNVFTGKGSN